MLVALAAAAFDYPDMYVRGEFNNWGYDDAHKLTRDGDFYSITMDELDGQFKVGNAEWTIDYGWSGGYPITGSCSIGAVFGGANIVASNLKNVTIAYHLLVDESTGKVLPSTIYISVPGEDDPVVPEYPNPDLSGTLPVLYINVYIPGSEIFDNEVISRNLSHKNYFDGEYWLELNGCDWMADEGAASIGSKDEPLPLQIKARGNFTRQAFSKKPFKLKLGAKQKMLGLSKSKHFALLAHADDQYGYMRNFTGFNLGKRIGLPWTPWQQPVEVVINGDYRGLYFLTESIRVEDDRVNIAELPDLCEDSEIISGGYLVELDNYDEENQIRMEEKSCVGGHLDMLRVTWDTPEEYSELQKRFVTDQFTQMNDLTGSASPELWEYIDADDAVRYYLVEEIISHVEAYHGSTYLYRDRGEDQKWHFSPLWDCGNAFNGPTDGYFYQHSMFGATWIPSFRAQATFNSRVVDTWKWFMSQRYDGIEDDLATYASHIKAAAAADRKRWKDAPLPDYWNAQPVVDNTDMTGALNRVKNHLNAKTQWLANQWGSYAAVAPEPARDTTPAAPLPDYAKPSGTTDIPMAAENDSPVTYYNLQGVVITSPVKGQLYIRHTPASTSKVIF